MKTVKNTVFIPYYLQLGFKHNRNLKNDIQNRIGADTESNFKNLLSNIQGDCKSRGGSAFDEVVLMAMAYFYDKIFPRKYNIKDKYWNIASIKGFFDACNYSPYTPIYEEVRTFYPLNDCALYNACWLVIQTAYFFNSKHFGRHQYLTYTGHYIRNGCKLPLSQYKYDKKDLQAQYKKIDERKKNKLCPKANPNFIM